MSPYIVITSTDTDFHCRLNDLLINEYYSIIHSYSIKQSIEAILHNITSIVFLDGGLLNNKDIIVCQLLREKYTGIIVILSVEDSPYFDEAEVLNYGADACFDKKENDAVLLANIQALLRREFSGNHAVSKRGNNIIEVQDLTIDFSTYQLIQKGEIIKLTSGELQLLIILAKQVGHVINRDDLFKDLMGTNYSGQSRSLDLRISSLRQKLGDTNPPYQYIKTIRGQGYLLAP